MKIKLKLQKEDIVLALSSLKKIAQKSSLITLKDTFKIVGAEGILYFFAASRELSLTLSIPTLEQVEDISIGIELERFLSFVKACRREAVISISITENTIQNKKVIITSGRSRILLAASDGSSFPEIPANRSQDISKQFTLNNKALFDGLSAIEYVVLPNPELFEYSSVLFDPSSEDGFIRIVGTNGFCLLMHKIPGVADESFQLRTDSIPLIKDIISNKDADCDILLSASETFIKTDTATLAVRKIHKDFPAYLKLFNTAKTYKIKICAQDLLDVVAKGKLIAQTTRSLIVHINISGEDMNFTARTPHGEFSDSISILEKSDVIDISFSLQLRMVEPITKAMKSEFITLELTNSISPILFKSENKNTVGVIMPTKENK